MTYLVKIIKWLHYTRCRQCGHRGHLRWNMVDNWFEWQAEAPVCNLFLPTDQDDEVVEGDI